MSDLRKREPVRMETGPHVQKNSTLCDGVQENNTKNTVVSPQLKEFCYNI